jgi:hypothetical protein
MLNEIFQAISRHDANLGHAEVGIVSSSDPVNSRIKVVIDQAVGSVETGWMAYATMWYGWYSPPVGGEQALVLYHKSNKLVPIGALLLYWNNALPPAGVALGEAIWKHTSGSLIKLNNDGTITIHGDSDVNVTTNGNANVTATGNATITAGEVANVNAGQVNINSSEVNIGPTGMGALKNIMNSLALDVYNTHTHPAPGGVTDVPNQQMDPTVLTSNTKAS